MPTVVEIGCGNSAGPFFDGFDTHYAVDTNEAKVNFSAKSVPELTPLVADATALDSLDDASVDVVLARNVFGDTMLGVNRGRAMDVLLTRSDKLLDGLDATVNSRKLAIMEEAGRILVSGGKLIIVEQYTPAVATEFFAKLASGELSSPRTLGTVESVELFDVTPKNYAEFHAGGVLGISTLSNYAWAAERR